MAADGKTGGTPQLVSLLGHPETSARHAENEEKPEKSQLTPNPVLDPTHESFDRLKRGEEPHDFFCWIHWVPASGEELCSGPSPVEGKNAFATPCSQSGFRALRVKL